jgi:urease accessory protein
MIEPAQLLLLLNITSPTFPTGAFAYSHGLEWAIATGAVDDADSLEAWIADLVTRGSGWNDALIIANCRPDNLSNMNALALALASSAERHLETTALGESFAEAVRAFVPLDLPEADEIAYPVAIAAAGLAGRVPPEALLVASLQNFAAGLVSVAVRLVPLGQKAGLRVLAALMPLIAGTARRALDAPLSELGAATFASDVAAMRHQFQEPRIFRT